MTKEEIKKRIDAIVDGSDRRGYEYGSTPIRHLQLDIEISDMREADRQRAIEEAKARDAA